MEVPIKKLHKDAVIPIFLNQGDVCADLHSIEDMSIETREFKVINTGIAIGLEPSWEAQIRPRSGLASKYGISVVNSPGTIDSGYRGEIKIILMNNGSNVFKISKGDRIAQIAIRRVPAIHFIEVEELTNTARGTSGLGSTGGISIEN